MHDAAGFFAAVKQGDATTVAAMLAAAPGLALARSGYDKTALHWAAELDRLDIACLLLEAGADIEARTAWGATPFDWAATMGSASVADMLLAHGASGLTIITAAALGKLDEVVRIVESGTDLSHHRSRAAPEAPGADWPADTAHLMGDVLSDALHSAARNGHVPVVEFLLSRGADIDAKGFFGATGLHWAAINGHAAMVELLLSRGARADLEDARFAATPAGWAAEGGHGAIVSGLLKHRTGTRPGGETTA